VSEPFFFTWSKQREAHGVEIVGGSGAFFDTADGERWLDFGSLVYSANLGHGHPRMIAAIKAQADRLCLAMPRSVFPEKRALAERLLALAGEGFTKVFFTLGGAEANENAIKMARLATGRTKVLSRYRSYHGATMGALSLTGDYRRPPLEPGLVGAIKALDCYCDRCPFGQELASCARECASHVGDVLRLEANVAAVFLEPVPGANGVLVPPDDYWPRVREACTEQGTLLVADEVLTGFGRTGTWLAHQRWGVTPDMITLSKGLTGGYGVLGAVLVHERVATHFEDTKLLAGLTQYAHPLGIAAALEALSIYEDEGLIDRAASLAPAFADGWAGIASRSDRVEHVRSIGLLGALELDHVDGLTQQLAARKIHAFVRGAEKMLIVAPPLCIDEAELADGFRRIEAALDA